MPHPRTKAAFAALAVAALAAACSDTRDLLTPPTGPSASASAAVQNDSDLVGTPGGWARRGCIHEVPNGATVERDGLVRRQDGTSYRIPPCPYAGRSRSRTAPLDTGWVESARFNPGINFSQISANWTVPAKPFSAYSSAQVYYSFPGLRNSSYVLQPVIQYGVGGGIGSSTQWVASAWRCSDGTDCHHGPVLNISAGDAMYGSVAASSCSGGTCSWTITIRDLTTGGVSTWTATDTDAYQDAIGGAVETHGPFNSCGYFPSGGVTYTNLTLTIASNGQPAGPTWASRIQSGLSPNCGFAVTSPNSATVNLLHPGAPRVDSVSTSPSPAVQYNPFTLTIKGAGFDPATAHVQIAGPNTNLCPCSDFTTFTSASTTQLVISPITYSLPGTYAVSVQNGSGAWGGGMFTTFTVRSMY